MTDTLLGRGVHLPLGMIESHMAALTRLGLPGLLGRECVARVAGVTRRRPISRTMLAQLSHFGRTLQSDFVATSAALLAFNHRHGLPMNGGHGLHCRPRQRVLSLLILLDLRGVAGCAGVRSG